MSNLTSYNYHVCSSFFFFSFHIGALQYPFCSAWRSEKSLSCPYFTKYAFEITILDHIIWSIIHKGDISEGTLGLEFAHIRVLHFAKSVLELFCSLICHPYINNISKTYFAKMMWVVQAKSLANLSKKVSI